MHGAMKYTGGDRLWVADLVSEKTLSKWIETLP